MNKDIDYDELDQAVSTAMGDGNVKNEQVPPEPSEPEPEVGEPEALRKPVKPRGFYMDMVNPKSPMRPLPGKAPAPRPIPHRTKPIRTTEFGIIEDSPTAIVEDFIAEPTPIEPEILDTYEEDPAPNPDNYTLGGRSPFIENAIVEKRPLGDDVPDSHTRSIRSTKNVYSERLVTSRQPAEAPLEHEIIPNKQTSGIARFFLVLLVIAIGAGIGIGAWYLISSGVINL